MKRHVVLLLTAAISGAVMAFAQYPDLDARRNTPTSLLFGVNMVADPEILYRPEGYHEDVYATLQRLGGTMVRLCASPREIEKERGTRRWEALDEEIALALKYGMEPMMLVCNTPLWALPDAIKTLPEGMDPTYQYPYRTELFPDWESFCRELAQRTRGRIRLFQIWNEPNGCSWHFHDGFNHADEYVPFLNVAYRGIKAGNPEALVLLGSLDDGGGNGHIFLNMCYDIRDREYPGQRLFDGVTVHPYDRDIAHKEWKLRRMYDIMARNGDGELPLFITEYGWRLGPWHEGEKSRLMGETLAMFQKADLPFLKGAIQLALADFSGEPGFGMTDENLRPKESFFAFQGAPRFGALPPWAIEWVPVAAGSVELRWKTMLPATTTLRLRRAGEAEDAFLRIIEIPGGTEHRHRLDGLAPGTIHEFSLQTRAVESGGQYRTPWYSFRIPDGQVWNGDFNEGFFAGIAEGWRTHGDGLYTDGAVFPGVALEPGEHAQVAFAVPEREMPLDTSAWTWVAVEPGRTYRFVVSASDASLAARVGVSARVGLDPAGGEGPRADSVVWSAWQPLEQPWASLAVTAEATASIVTVLVQAKAGSGEPKSRPAIVFDRAHVEPVEP